MLLGHFEMDTSIDVSLYAASVASTIMFMCFLPDMDVSLIVFSVVGQIQVSNPAQVLQNPN